MLRKGAPTEHDNSGFWKAISSNLTTAASSRRLMASDLHGCSGANGVYESVRRP